MRVVLKGLTATGGYLEQVAVKFHAGLTCIIGARGTCKSTLVESIRFAFDSDPERVEALLGRERTPSGFGGMVAGTLASGSIRCEVADVEAAARYDIERDVQAPPRIYREGVKDHTDTGLLHQIEIYSQGDLQRIAEDEHLRLRLIDRPNLATIRRLRDEQRQIAEELASLGGRLRELRGQAAQLRTELRGLPELRAQFEQARRSRPEVSHELDAERAQFQKRQATLKAINDGIVARDTAATAVLAVRDHLGALRDARERVHRQELAECRGVAEVLAKADGLLADLLTQAAALHAVPLATARDEFRTTAEEMNETYYALRKREQDANEALKREDVLKQQVDHLEGQQWALAQVETQITAAVARRAELRAEFKARTDEVYRLRVAEVNAINERHTGFVLLTLDQGALGRDYVAAIQKMLERSHLRKQDELAQEIATSLPPASLVDLVEAGDTPNLANALGRDAGQIAKLMSTLSDSARLYDLEGHIFEDRLTITLFDNGQPKPVQNLSKGQKATALLPLILRPAPYPLVFDQPEDDLDNRFIFHSLVRSIRHLKSERQLIFVTHNANIPVIGEADAVVVMHMESPTRAAPPMTGTVDERRKEIVDLLEGGADAFLERHRRYQTLLGAAGGAHAE